MRTDAFLQAAMDRWGDSVYRLALCQLGSEADAEDVFQDVFLRLLQDETAFHSDEHLKAWLLRVTLNRCHDLHRSAWRRRTQTLDDSLRAADPDPAEDGALRACEVREAVEALPPKLSAVIHLYYEEGYSVEEVAQLLNCRPATVRTRMHRARKRLKELLEGGNGDDPSGFPVAVGTYSRAGIAEK